MAQINIPSTGLWDTISTALNSMFTEQYNSSGWGYYVDTVYTEGTPLTVAVGETVALPNNKGTVIETYLPDNVTTFYDGTRVISDNVGAGLELRVNFKAKTTSNNGAFALSYDISALGDGSNVITERAETFVRGTGVEQSYSFSTSLFSLDTFVANGALPKFESINGTSSVYDITFLIKRDHRAF